MRSIQRAFVVVFTGLQECFPYWILGWNFVGMNNDNAHPCLMNNGQFQHALRRMGFDVPAFDYYAACEWERTNMLGLSALEHMENAFYSRAPDIEPRNAWLGEAPRLCKRWWDREFIVTS